MIKNVQLLEIFRFENIDLLHETLQKYHKIHICAFYIWEFSRDIIEEKPGKINELQIIKFRKCKNKFNLL